jgi:hypothetical protein
MLMRILNNRNFQTAATRNQGKNQNVISLQGMSFQEAKASSNVYVIMEGDYRGQCYLTAPMRIVLCKESELQQLLQDIDKICWNDIEGTRLSYARHEPGDLIDSGMDGGSIQQDLWIHKDLADLHLEGKVRRVLEGSATRMGSLEEIAQLRSRFLDMLGKKPPDA